MVLERKILSSLTLVIVFAMGGACRAQDGGFAVRGQSKPTAQDAQKNPASTPAEDFSGMYSFLKEGEFLQINVDKSGVSGYISRMGETDSDSGVFLDQFFDKVQIQGRDVSFITKPLHNLWYDFKGKFERGPVALQRALEFAQASFNPLLQLAFQRQHGAKFAKRRLVVHHHVDHGLIAQPGKADAPRVMWAAHGFPAQ